MTAHNFMKRDAQKYLKVLSSVSRVGPCQGKANIIPDTRRLGEHLLLPIGQRPLPLWRRNELFQWSGRRGRPRGIRDEGSWSDWGPFLNDSHHFVSQIWERLVLLGLHLSVHLSVKLGCHLCMPKSMCKKKKKKKKKNNNNNNKREKKGRTKKT